MCMSSRFWPVLRKLVVNYAFSKGEMAIFANFQNPLIFYQAQPKAGTGHKLLFAAVLRIAANCFHGSS